ARSPASRLGRRSCEGRVVRGLIVQLLRSLNRAQASNLYLQLAPVLVLSFPPQDLALSVYLTPWICALRFAQQVRRHVVPGPQAPKSLALWYPLGVLARQLCALLRPRGATTWRGPLGDRQSRIDQRLVTCFREHLLGLLRPLLGPQRLLTFRFLRQWAQSASPATSPHWQRLLAF